jgi:hypothetical protein
MSSIIVGKYTTKPGCEAHECLLAETCSTFEGRREVALGIIGAFEAGDPSLLDPAFTEGQRDPKGDRSTRCVHLARRVAQCVPELEQASVEGTERILEWTVDIGYSKDASINQPRE